MLCAVPLPLRPGGGASWTTCKAGHESLELPGLWAGCLIHIWEARKCAAVTEVQRCGQGPAYGLWRHCSNLSHIQRISMESPTASLGGVESVRALTEADWISKTLDTCQGNNGRSHLYQQNTIAFFLHVAVVGTVIRNTG